jgi:lipase
MGGIADSPRGDSEPRLIDVKVQGGNLCVALWGELTPGATAVLAIHGLTMSHRTWSAVAKRLPGIPVIAPDLRGRGASSELPEPYSFAQHVSDLEAVTSQLGLRRVVVAGHAMGGYLAEQFADRRPDLVAEVVLVDGGLTPTAPIGVRFDDFIEQFLGPALRRMTLTCDSLDDYRQFWRAHPAFAGPPEQWNADIESFVDYDLVQSGQNWRSRTSEAAVRHDFAEGRFNASTREVAFGLTDVPITLLQAEGGLLNQKPGLIPDSLVEEYQKYLPQLAVTFVPDANHYTITLAEPGLAAVTETLTQAIKRVDAEAHHD